MYKEIFAENFVHIALLVVEIFEVVCPVVIIFSFGRNLKNLGFYACFLPVNC
jgi:hypothetical protein